MEITVRGTVQVPIRVENLGDMLNVQRGFFKAELVRSVQIPDASDRSIHFLLRPPRSIH